VDINGGGVPAYSVLDEGQQSPPISLTTLRGRPPQAADEADIGPGTPGVRPGICASEVSERQRAYGHLPLQQMTPTRRSTHRSATFDGRARQPLDLYRNTRRLSLRFSDSAAQ